MVSSKPYVTKHKPKPPVITENGIFTITKYETHFTLGASKAGGGHYTITRSHDNSPYFKNSQLLDILDELTLALTITALEHGDL